MPSARRSRKSAAAIHPRVFRQRVRVASSQRWRFEPRSGCSSEVAPRRAGIVRVRVEVDFPACGAASATRHAISDDEEDPYFGEASFFFKGSGWRRSQASCGTDRLVPHRLQTQMSTLPVRTANTISFDKQTGQRAISSHGSGGSCFAMTRHYQCSPSPPYGKHRRDYRRS